MVPSTNFKIRHYADYVVLLVAIWSMPSVCTSVNVNGSGSSAFFVGASGRTEWRLLVWCVLVLMFFGLPCVMGPNYVQQLFIYYESCRARYNMERNLLNKGLEMDWTRFRFATVVVVLVACLG